MHFNTNKDCIFYQANADFHNMYVYNYKSTIIITTLFLDSTCNCLLEDVEGFKG